MLEASAENLPVTEALTPDHEVYLPGNADFGLWGSPALELVAVGRSPYDAEVLARVPPVESGDPRGFERVEEPRPENGPGQSYVRFFR